MEEKKKKALNTLSIAGGLSALSFAAFVAIYDKMFPRLERPDYLLNIDKIDYKLYKNSLPREELTFLSKDVLLKGYYYSLKNPKGLVVVCHGMKSGADDYLPIIEFFYKNKYNVFSFDCTGTYDSQGKSTVGMCQPLIDLDNALTFVKNEKKFKSLPIYLIGHSWGGYAVGSVVLLHKDIKAVACISPVVDAHKLILEKKEQYIKKTILPSWSFLDIYQKHLFGEYCKYNIIRGINESNIPFFIAHGINDEVILFKSQSIFVHQNELTNHNIKYYIGKGFQSGHDSIWRSINALAYKNKIESEIKLQKIIKDSCLSNQEIIKIYNDVDYKLYNEINYELFEQILKMFNEA